MGHVEHGTIVFGVAVGVDGVVVGERQMFADAADLLDAKAIALHIAPGQAAAAVRRFQLRADQIDGERADQGMR